MMGTKSRIFTPVAVVSLDELVPATHFYRHLDRVVDLSFVRLLNDNKNQLVARIRTADVYTLSAPV